MAYELVLVLVSSDDPSPIDRAQSLITPFWHHRSGDCCDCREDEDLGWQGVARGHYWDYGSTPGWREQGTLWRDRYGAIREDHPIGGPLDELRRAGDIDLRAQLLDPEALITPDGNCYFMGEPHKGEGASMKEFAEFEDRLAAHPDCVAVPLWCHC